MKKKNINGLKGKLKFFPIMISVLIFMVILATAFGAVSVPLLDTAKIILKNLGIANFESVIDSQESIIFYVRFPRVIVTVLVGAALAASGTVMQGMFRNPMADPGIIGVSSGASLGALLAITLGLASKNMYYMPVLAIIGALMAAWVIYIIASKGGKIPILTLVLSGIAVSTFIGAINSLILTKIDEFQIKQFLFWSMGSLSDRRWEHVSLVLIPIIIGILVLFIFSRDLNVLLLGEEEAQSVGLNPSKTRKKLLFFSSITTALAVCVSGSISFVGLIIPHIMRLIVGPDNRILLPASSLAGAIFLVGCDLIARVIIMPAEVGVGIVTSLVGAPYFIYLLNKARNEGVGL